MTHAQHGPGVGVMHSDYAAERSKKPHLIFRYLSRALVAAEAQRRHGRVPEKPRVLEMGAAEGRTLLALRDLLGAQGDYTGVELSESLLKAVPPLPTGVRIIPGDVTQLPPSVGASSYDLVTALAVLEHLDDPALAVREAHRVLRPGGLFVATAPNPTWDKISTRAGLLRGEYHAVELTLSRMAELARAAGFSFVRVERFMWAPVAFLPYLRVPVSPRFALAIDRVIARLRIFDLLFVNQVLIARR